MRKSASVTLALFGACLFLNVVTPISLPQWAFDVMIIYVAVNSISAPFAISHRFITPKVVNPKCPFCKDVYMDTIKLKCPKCGCVSGKDK